MLFYTVKKNDHYIDRGRFSYGSPQPVPMLRREAEYAAYQARGVVQVWDGNTLVREYRMLVVLPRSVLSLEVPCAKS